MDLLPAVSTDARGWIPWFAENRLHLLGWVRRGQDGRVYGVELEVMTLLSRLITVFPPAVEDPWGNGELPGKMKDD